jgi:Dolichyl-phosphate-mannose-protein mannosyltransferase
MSTIAPRSTPLAAKIFLALTTAACLYLSFRCAYARLLMPFEIDYEEGNILNSGLRIVQGQTLYPAVGSFPYILNPYGPVGYLVSALGIKIFGLGLFGPRLFILSAGIAVAILIAAITKALGGRWDACALLGLSYLCLPLVSYWLPLLRVDFWAVFLSLLGLYVLSRFRSAWPLAALLFASAILTKQTAVAAPVAVFLELVAQRRFARAFGVLGIVVGTVLACMEALGRGFIFAFLKTHPDPYSFYRAFQSGLAAVHGCMLILVVIAYAAVFGFRWTERSRLAWLYVSLCSLSALSAGKLGSNMNHFLEWTAAVCIIAGLALSELLQREEALAKSFSLGMLILAAVFAALSLRNFGVVGPERKGCVDAYGAIRSFPGQRVMSDDVTALVLGGKDVLVSNPFVTTQIGNSITWQAGSVEQLVQRQYFDLIVLGGTLDSYVPSAGGESPQLIQAIGEHYVPDKYFECAYAKVAFIPTTKEIIGTPGSAAMH